MWEAVAAPIVHVVLVALLQGYQGMVDGGEDNIIEATWESVSSMLQVVSKDHYLTNAQKEEVWQEEVASRWQAMFLIVHKPFHESSSWND